MTTYVALLRAVNVGAANRCTMVDLRAAFVGAGFVDAVTHIQTGNIIFASSEKAAAVKPAVEGLVKKGLGITTIAMIRTAKQMAAVAKANPFADKDPKQVYVFYLDGTPSKAALDALVAVNPPNETFDLVGTELFVHYRNGLGTSKFSNAVIEKKLGVAATARNLNVTKKLAELSAAFGR